MLKHGGVDGVFHCYHVHVLRIAGINRLFLALSNNFRTMVSVTRVGCNMGRSRLVDFHRRRGSASLILRKEERKIVGSLIVLLRRGRRDSRQVFFGASRKERGARGGSGRDWDL